MKLARSALLGAASLALALGTAYGAAGKTKDKVPGFSTLDKNLDGYLSRTEAQGNHALAKKFTTADKNHDGKLTRSEYLAATTRHDSRNK